MDNRKKISVVLFNLGGPDSRAAIRPFLINFFMDPAIITAPWPVRFFVSRLIAARRSKKQAGDAYGMLGDKSPLLDNTNAQARALQAVLNEKGDADYAVHVCMNYWHPMADAVVRDVAAARPDKIILLPLYPQFSTTTTGSSWTAWDRAAKKISLNAPTDLVCCYPGDAGFITASAKNIRAAYDQFLIDYPGVTPRVLFSAHGLPEKIIAAGDPYQTHCEKSAAVIAAATGIENLDWQICYQSRVGPLKWIGPSTEEALHKAAKDNVGVIIYPPAFVSEHVETLVEIEHEYRDLAASIGIPAFARVGTAMTQPDFINGLADIVRARTDTTHTIASASGSCECGKQSTKCPMRRAA